MSDNVFYEQRESVQGFVRSPSSDVRVAGGTGIRQRMAVLLAATALQQAHTRIAEDAAAQQLPDDVIADYKQRRIRAAADESMDLPFLFGTHVCREDLALAWERAIVWEDSSDVAELALGDVLDRYRREYGLVIDLAAGTIAVDDHFDAPRHQLDLSRATSSRRIEAAVEAATGVVDTAGLTEADTVAARNAVSRWASVVSTGGDPEEPGNRLGTQLAATGLNESDRASIEFVTGYLGSTSKIDLAAAPMLVDPGDAIKAEIAGMLEDIRDRPVFGRPRPNISWLLPQDRQLIRDRQAQITTGNSEHWLEVWPNHVDRPELIDSLHEYAAGVAEAHHYADYLAETTNPQIAAFVPSLISGLRHHRHALMRALRDGIGLLDIERALLTEVVAGLDLGEPIPELLLVDEQSKAAADLGRHHHRVELLRRDAEADLSATLTQADMPITSDNEHRAGSAGLEDDLYELREAGWRIAHGAKADSQPQRQYRSAARRIDERLTASRVPDRARTMLQTLINTQLDDADRLGRAQLERMSQWHDRINAVVDNRDHNPTDVAADPSDEQLQQLATGTSIVEAIDAALTGTRHDMSADTVDTQPAHPSPPQLQTGPDP
ncbi:hypothetical protein OHB12_12145 [Nocardia sp. NBC_01730]|uniref:hypothetical protein n=1 Tax=Nocardia sp. NBC_01730 TaxID=2975998 RepID=UPI002E13404D|nr:hypothetical protein OHB12_12145 [Nocardia sp. NBC_01730]